MEYRKAERNAYCRCCDKVIKKGDDMITGYSHRNKGMSMHFHPECVRKMAELIPDDQPSSEQCV